MNKCDSYFDFYFAKFTLINIAFQPQNFLKKFRLFLLICSLYYNIKKLIFKFKSEIRITPTAVNEEIKLLQSYSGDDSNRNVLKSIKHISGTIYLVAMRINNNCPICLFFFLTLIRY